jgi:DNA polymerase III epsilon subunit-like protein
VFDLKTTGFSRNYHDIIEICAVLVDSNGKEGGKDASMFHSLVKPPAPINPLITGITGISNDTVATAPSFQECGHDFIKFLKDNCKKRSTIGDFGLFDCENEGEDRDRDDNDEIGSDDDDDDAPTILALRDIVLVAHNGNRFDIPFLFKSFEQYGVDITGIPFKGKIDTIDLVKSTIRANITMRVPDNYQLTTIYKYATGLEHDDGHRAKSDARATLAILTAESFWLRRKDVCKVITNNIANIATINSPTSRPPVEEDSDTDGESDLEESDDDNIDEEYIETNGNERWRMNTPFIAPDVERRYDDVFTRETRSQSDRRHPGIKISRNTVNSPIKAWNYIFTEHLLSKIMKYTNEYGQEKCSRWTDITTTDLREFIAILFIAGIQKRKDKTTNWWSDDPLLELPIVKKIMSGKKFHMMLQYLHVCDMNAQPSVHSPSYSPLFKVQELMDYIVHRSKLAFEAGPSLSLDESLIRAFGRIKFKVRIITKSARYGIKIYVLADARTSYVMNVLVYTGQYTYNNSASNTSEDTKKTVKVCMELCRPYKGSHRVVYVDRFYTSIELLKELEKIDLYVTGTVMSNRIPDRLRITKRCNEFKEMQRGDHKMHVLEYKTHRQKDSKMGLVCWKDKDIVYCLTNATSTAPTGHCFHRSQSGRICMSRPCKTGV